MFEMTDSRLGQDFNDLLSSHMDQPGDAGYAEQTEQHRASGGHERPYSDDRDFGDTRPGDTACNPDECDRERNSAEADAVQDNDSAKREDEAETAKAAAPEQDCQPSEEEDMSAAPATEEPGYDSAASPAGQVEDAADDSAGQALETSAETIAAKIQALLDGLAESVAGASLDSGSGGIKAKVVAMHELLRQFRESDPASRSELAVTLGDEIRALKAELAAIAQARAASFGESGRKTGNSDQAASGTLQRIEGLLQRLQGRGSLEKGGGNQARGGEEKAFALGGKPSSGTAESARPGSVKISPAAVAAMQPADKNDSIDEEKYASQGAASSAKKSGKGQGVALRSTSHEKAASEAVLAQAKDAARVESGVKTRLTPESAENAQGPRGGQESALSAAEQKTAEKAQQDGRQESVMRRNGLPAAKSGDAAPRDAQQTLNQDTTSPKQEGGAAASGSNRSADSEGGAKQHDARQGFFTASDREKTSSSTLRSAQSAGAEKGASESLTQASAQNSQTSFQQRLESPVSARSAQVYQQVENGAFKNLGQGVKQLVIRLDPADLGQVSVILQVRGKEVQAVLRSSSQEASAALNEQLGQLRSQLEAQGLKVGKLEVQTQLADSQSQSQWQGAQSHNRHQENQELAMSARRWRSLGRVAPDLAQDVHNSLQREKLSQSGLDIFA
jgi:flagellar hook-length control protein FliK